MFKDFRYSMDTPQTRRSFYYSFRSIFRYSMDTPQTRRSLYYSFRISKSRYSTDTLQTRKSFCHSFKYQLQFKYTPDTEVILLFIRISTSDIVQIRSRHSIHVVTYSDFFPSSEMLQTRISFCRLFRFHIQTQYKYTPDTEVILLFIQNQIQLQLRYAPDTDAIPLLIQTQSPDTVQIGRAHV